MIFEILLAIPIVIVALYQYRWRARNPQGLPLPPGPKGYPVIGNVYDMPQESAWREFAKWGEKYGDLVYFHILGKECIVINSPQIAHELLDKRSSIYSYRPYFAMAHDVIGWSWALPIMEYNETFKRHRRYLNTYFHKQHLHNYYHLEQREVHRLLNDFLEDPENYASHIKRLAGGVTMNVTYGHVVNDADDPFISVAEKGVRTIEAAGAIGAHIVDFLPWLRHIPDWMPGARIKAIPPGTREDMEAFINMPYNKVKEEMANGTAKACYVSGLLESTKFEDEEGVRATAAITYSAGFDTTLSGLMTVMVALVAHPLVQARVQAEMDLVVGKDRLPTFSDRDQLPYLHAVITESFRYAATTPVGVPHKAGQEDYYNGYYIPKDCMIIANAWWMLYDPKIYPEPEKFNPDRYIAVPGRTPQPDPRGPAFGFGRRVCPGKDLAENHLWVTIASIFYAFKVTPAVDENGNEIPIDLEFSEHSIRHPKPFKCQIRPRRPNSAALIRNTKFDLEA